MLRYQLFTKENEVEVIDTNDTATGDKHRVVATYVDLVLATSDANARNVRSDEMIVLKRLMLYSTAMSDPGDIEKFGGGALALQEAIIAAQATLDKEYQLA